MTQHTKLFINSINCYSFHGCLPEEAIIGGHYKVDVEIEMDFSKAMASDELSETVDYGMVYQVVAEQMAIRSKLIEHAGARILDALNARIGGPKTLKVVITKFAPPVNGPMETAVFQVEKVYNE
jgi:dihydroneopterin aldolase